ncbi:hypothetical protein NX059_001730 [Plenodomus lindquistii]|nr:hypothetical protein NX059_001730 [Plenodomus lindquistii]
MAPTQYQESFHPFPHLPYELRMQIWAYAIPESFLKTATSFSSGRGCIRLYKSAGLATPRLLEHARPYPALFAVNREARFETARIDRGEWLPLDLSAPEDEGGTGTGTEKAKAKARIYVNLDKESVVLYNVVGENEVVRVWGRYWAKPMYNFLPGSKMHCVVRER